MQRIDARITGGADVAEPFRISEQKEIPKGALVLIDEAHPGQLKLSDAAYDTRVAGIVSGAGGVQPGISLQQEGALEGGQPVALTGRACALADAAHGPIKPGDLLTTSEMPGHAMKVTDRDPRPRCHPRQSHERPQGRQGVGAGAGDVAVKVKRYKG